MEEYTREERGLGDWIRERSFTSCNREPTKSNIYELRRTGGRGWTVSPQRIWSSVLYPWTWLYLEKGSLQIQSSEDEAMKVGSDSMWLFRLRRPYRKTSTQRTTLGKLKNAENSQLPPEAARGPGGLRLWPWPQPFASRTEDRTSLLL